MRGKGEHVPRAVCTGRITPAYAGKSQFGRSIQFQSKDHPRLCGEKGNTVHWYETLKGSPPPMRGKVTNAVYGSQTGRITPAYAGKSSQHLLCHQVGRDHPRLCGEKPEQVHALINNPGSPPPMRGKVLLWIVVYKRGRITPAYAGKRRVCPAICRISWDHPRLCGEKKRWTRYAPAALGSPPPMRGKVQLQPYCTNEDGITPAYAGKRRSECLRSPGIRDHPRLCGEKTKKIPKQRYFFHQSASFSFSLQYT